MCHYIELLGEDGAVIAQTLAIIGIVSGIVFWVLMYRWQKISLRPYALPIMLWIIFGALDIAITAKGTYGNPLNEGNPLARFVFVQIGFAGPAVASVLWISLWSFLVFVINKKIKNPLAAFLSLAIFYSLAVGHLFGFSSWYAPFCGLSKAYAAFLPEIPKIFKITAAGVFIALMHSAAGSHLKTRKAETKT